MWKILLGYMMTTGQVNQSDVRIICVWPMVKQCGHLCICVVQSDASSVILSTNEKRVYIDSVLFLLSSMLVAHSTAALPASTVRTQARGQFCQFLGYGRQCSASRSVPVLYQWLTFLTDTRFWLFVFHHAGNVHLNSHICI